MFLVTPRLLLRPPWPEDAPAIAAAMSEEVARQTGSIPWPYALSDAQGWIAGLDSASVLRSYALILERERGAVAGAVGFSGNLLNGATEIGYWLARPAWGRGIATEAGRAWLNLAFDVLRLPELYAGHFADNPASGAVLVKLGFRPTGAMFDYPCKARGQTVRSPEYHLTRTAWQALGMTRG